MHHATAYAGRMMGGKGFPAAPTKVKLLRGETRPCRVNYHEPLPPDGLPTMPTDMTVEAKVVWRRVIRNVGQTGIIRAVDLDVLRCYCEAVARYVQAARLYSGPLLKTRGGPVKNPLHQIVREDSEAIRQFARELGLSPSARSALTAMNEPEEGDALDRWMAGKTG
jgi:P27 family predicted phage terminase small subunit